jgi:GTP pyrophosphokinase
MDFLLTSEERSTFLKNYRRLLQTAGDTALPGDVAKLKHYIRIANNKNAWGKDVYGLNILNRTFHTALIVSEEIGLKRSAILAVFLSHLVVDKHCHINEIEKDFGEDTAGIIRGLAKTHQLYDKKAAIDNENFRNLLLSFAEDVRVILIMIAERLYLMRIARHLSHEEHRLQIAAEASYLYAPLSHRLGLYKIKSELEDLALKFQDREMYDFIARKINETKRSRDRYIAEFIAPVKKKLQEMGLNFDIKGRTKSIHSIRNKLLKQQIEFENIYDLFAIRIILDTPLEKEKAECWQVYSLITDMYQPNPKRMKDWLSIPKSNGYESLHTTVMGPEGRWVEVQIRSKRMDEIAEKGLAAHWKYKGGKSSGLDNWLNNVREVLEHKDSTPADLIHDFKLDLYDEEIFVFTPKGDLFKLPQNATVLDFAFAVHTKIGSRCVSARINGKNVSIRHKLQSGDQVDIQTSPNQTPKQDWLGFVVTGKARVKIKQSLKEQAAKQVEFARELLERRFKNRKIEADDAVLMRLIKKKGYKNVTGFYADIATQHLDVNAIIDQYLELEKKEQDAAERSDRSVENYHAPLPPEEIVSKEDVLVIDKNLTGIDYTLAKCCNPIYGDEIFGFVSTQGIKIHRLNCPNAPAMFKKYGYRIVKSRWAGKAGDSYSVTLKVVGIDDIGIVTNITSLISRENGMTLRSILVDSSDGLFLGTLTVMLSDTAMMNSLIKKIKAVKGVKQVSRY